MYQYFYKKKPEHILVVLDFYYCAVCTINYILRLNNIFFLNIFQVTLSRAEDRSVRSRMQKKLPGAILPDMVGILNILNRQISRREERIENLYVYSFNVPYKQTTRTVREDFLNEMEKRSQKISKDTSTATRNYFKKFILWLCTDAQFTLDKLVLSYVAFETKYLTDHTARECIHHAEEIADLYLSSEPDRLQKIKASHDAFLNKPSEQARILDYT